MSDIIVINADDQPIDFYLDQNSWFRLSPGQSLTTDNPFFVQNPSLSDLIQKGYIIIEFINKVEKQENVCWIEEGF